MLLRKPRAYAEVYNDLDGEVVNLFRMVRDRGNDLARLCALTPFARVEFDASYTPATDPLEQARRTLARSFMGFGSAGVAGQQTGFRYNTTRSWSTPAQNWASFPDHLGAIVERLRGVVIEHRDALACMQAHDGPEVLHYVDPPYVHDTRHYRAHSPSYRHEMTVADHELLAKGLLKLQGQVIVSGYRCDLYDDMFSGWNRIDKNTHTDGARPRLESLWLSPSVPTLFDFHEAEASPT